MRRIGESRGRNARGPGFSASGNRAQVASRSFSSLAATTGRRGPSGWLERYRSAAEAASIGGREGGPDEAGMAGGEFRGEEEGDETEGEEDGEGDQFHEGVSFWTLLGRPPAGPCRGWRRVFDALEPTLRKAPAPRPWRIAAATVEIMDGRMWRIPHPGQGRPGGN